jgi:hypothetical protein
MGGCFGHQRKLLAGFLTDADASLAAESDEAFEARVVAFASHKYMVEAAPAGFERFLNRMHSV